MISENPEWYRKFCAGHASHRKGQWRKHKTSIKRRETVKTLRHIAAGRQPQKNPTLLRAPVYQQWLKPIIRAEIAADRERAKAEQSSVMEGVPF